MKKKLVALSLCGLLLCTTACGNTKLKNGEEVVASVKGYEVTAEDLYEELKGSYGYDILMNKINSYIASKEIKTTDEINKYADQVVNYYSQYAESYGVSIGEFITKYVGLSGVDSEDKLREYAINERKVYLLAAKEIGKKYTDEEIEKYYKENYSDKLTVKHILIEIDKEADSDDEDAENDALETAEDIIDQLKGIKDSKKLNEKFDELALKYSADSSYNNGGLLENFMKSDVVPEFWEAAYNLKNGKVVSEPVKTDYGYHVILKVSSTKKESLKKATTDIRSKLAQAEMANDQLLQATALNDIRKNYKFKISDSTLKKLHKDFVNSLTAKPAESTNSDDEDVSADETVEADADDTDDEADADADDTDDEADADAE